MTPPESSIAPQVAHAGGTLTLALNDFGIAKTYNGVQFTAQRATSDGKLRYWIPEECKAGSTAELGWWTDLFAIAKLFVYILVNGRSEHDLCKAIRGNGRFGSVQWFGSTEESRQTHMPDANWRNMFKLIETACSPSVAARCDVTYLALWSALIALKDITPPLCLSDPLTPTVLRPQPPFPAAAVVVQAPKRGLPAPELAQQHASVGSKQQRGSKRAATATAVGRSHDEAKF